MTPDRAVLAALRKKLGGVSNQAVQQRRARLQKLIGMPNNIANAILAQREGVPISRMLDTETLRAVAEFEAKLIAKEGSAPASTRQPRKTQPKATVVKEVRLGETSIPTEVLSPAHVREAGRMAKVYPFLYIFENSIREFIDGHLVQAHGKDWWDDQKIVPTEVRRTVEISRKAEAENRTHTSRKARPIYYTTLSDLVRIVESEHGWKVFKPPLFPRRTWFPELVRSSEVSRNIVAHMNSVQPADVRRLEMALKDWLSQIKGHEPTVVT